MFYEIKYNANYKYKKVFNCSHCNPIFTSETNEVNFFSLQCIYTNKLKFFVHFIIEILCKSFHYVNF